MKSTDQAKNLADIPETLEEAREILALVDDSPSASWVKIANLQSENVKLREEVEVLRAWGNKDCTAMADAELERRRNNAEARAANA